MLKELWSGEDGLTTVEYALLLMLVTVASATAWATVGTGTTRCAEVSSQALSH